MLDAEGMTPSRSARAVRWAIAAVLGLLATVAVVSPAHADDLPPATGGIVVDAPLSAQVGETFEVVVRAEAARTIGDFSIKLRFDTARFAIDNTTVGQGIELYEGGDGDAVIDGDVVQIDLAEDGASINGVANLAAVEFRAISPGAGAITYTYGFYGSSIDGQTIEEFTPVGTTVTVLSPNPGPAPATISQIVFDTPAQAYAGSTFPIPVRAIGANGVAGFGLEFILDPGLQILDPDTAVTFPAGRTGNVQWDPDLRRLYVDGYSNGTVLNGDGVLLTITVRGWEIGVAGIDLTSGQLQNAASAFSPAPAPARGTVNLLDPSVSEPEPELPPTPPVVVPATPATSALPRQLAASGATGDAGPLAVVGLVLLAAGGIIGALRLRRGARSR
ncbi:hypothetical protein GCM10009807_03160 [Microbacterium lacus]|uniref:Cohesin domain-containing protein n=2 Tax=Microbacterium lacus TaxID=415217 RepID=A0ABP4RVE1_9MICO